MQTLLQGRHNEHFSFVIYCAFFLLGCILCLFLFTTADATVYPDSTFWHSYWQSQIPPWTVLLCLLPILMALLFSQLGRFGHCLVCLSFLVQGAILCFCMYITCMAVPDIGVFLALFSMAAPAFFLLVTQLCCMIHDFSNQQRLFLLLIGAVVTFTARCIGYDIAGDIYI